MEESAYSYDEEVEDIPISAGEVHGELHDHHSPEQGNSLETRQRRTLGRGLFGQLKEMIRDSVREAIDAITPGHRRQRREARLPMPPSQVPRKDQAKALKNFQRLNPSTFPGSGGPKLSGLENAMLVLNSVNQAEFIVDIVQYRNEVSSRRTGVLGLENRGVITIGVMVRADRWWSTASIKRFIGSSCCEFLPAPRSRGRSSRGLLESGDDEGTGCLYDKSPGFESPERCITIFNVSDDEGALSKVIKAEETSTSDNDMRNYEDESWGYRWRKGSPEDPYPNRYWIPHDYHGRRLMEINRRAMRPISIEREPEPDKLLKMGKPDKPEKPAFVGAGIKNLEQTCYMNAVLQCVTHTVPFVSSLLLHEEMPECADHPGFCTLCTVRDHIKQSLDFPCKVIFPVTLADNLEQISDTFHKYRQEDAHIFLHCLFEKLDSCWLNHQKSSTTAPEQNNDS
ncbi:hypothetical protein Drorol1_Dr00026797 [Drosera rotundifolia]